MRRAGQADLPAIRSFLQARVDRAMFPLSNLARYGLDGDHRYAPRFWMADQNGAVSDVLTVSKSGMVMPALPTGDWPRAAKALAGRTIEGLIGPAEEVRPLIAALGLAGHRANLDHDEPHFAMDLAALVIPDGPGRLVPLGEAPEAEMAEWRIAYETEALGLTADAANAAGRQAYEHFVAEGTHRVLVHEGRALATTGFNAQLSEIVQIGGVYTPPALRGRGHARRAVALHLAEARAQGVRRATLFSASDMAARAYRAIGFRRIGNWSLVLFAEPWTVPR